MGPFYEVVFFTEKYYLHYYDESSEWRHVAVELTEKQAVAVADFYEKQAVAAEDFNEKQAVAKQSFLAAIVAENAKAAK